MTTSPDGQPPWLTHRAKTSSPESRERSARPNRGRRAVWTATRRTPMFWLADGDLTSMAVTAARPRSPVTVATAPHRMVDRHDPTVAGRPHRASARVAPLCRSLRQRPISATKSQCPTGIVRRRTRDIPPFFPEVLSDNFCHLT